MIFGERHLRHWIKEFVEHYMTELFRQGIGWKSDERRWPIRKNNNKDIEDNKQIGFLNLFFGEEDYHFDSGIYQLVKDQQAKERSLPPRLSGK